MKALYPPFNHNHQWDGATGLLAQQWLSRPDKAITQPLNGSDPFFPLPCFPVYIPLSL